MNKEYSISNLVLPECLENRTSFFYSKRRISVKQALSYFLVCVVFFSSAQDIELTELSLEELIEIKITSVSKKSESLQSIASSIYVITSKDIQRSSAQNLMQLLRDHVPGYWANANDYRNADANMRNFYESSILVLLDGTPLLDIIRFDLDYETLDIPFEYIERIEVIKGSGGTIYGANSASGIVSIITKNTTNLNRLFVSSDYATPGQFKTEFIVKPLQTEKTSVSIYGKYTTFDGFDQLNVIKDEQSVVPQTFGSGTTTINSRFTGDDDSFNLFNLGFGWNHKASTKLELSSRFNFVSTENDRYYQHFLPSNGTFVLDNGYPQPRSLNDQVFLESNNKVRITGNVRADFSFSENHAVFVRASTNMEDKAYGYGRSEDVFNGIYDFEVQNNFSLGINQVSLGANYRLVNYDFSFSEESNAVPLKTNPHETLLGLFAQNKISLFNERLDVYLGGKLENFSLVNDQYYFSPMAKVGFQATDQLFLWAGFTQAYTTPSYEQTNGYLNIFTAPSPSEFLNTLHPALTSLYEVRISAGDSHTQAIQFIQDNAGLPSDIVESIEVFAKPFEEEIAISIVNNEDIEPASFKNYEFGARFHLLNRVQFASSFFYTEVDDAIGSSGSELTGDIIPSPIHPSRNIFALFYGNFLEGYNMGLESEVRIQIGKKILLEVSHSYYHYEVDYQENDLFDINQGSFEERDNDWKPLVPKNVFRGKIYYDPIPSLRLTGSLTYATAYQFKTADITTNYQLENQRFNPLYDDGTQNSTLFGQAHSDRTLLNVRVDKSFLNETLNTFIYGYDLTKMDHFVEGTNQIELNYPRQVGGMIGLGVQYHLY